MENGWEFMNAVEDGKTWLPKGIAPGRATWRRGPGPRGMDNGRFRSWLGLAFCLIAGCTAQRPWVDRALMAEPTLPGAINTTASEYLVSCPDLLEIRVAGRPDLSSMQEIAGDGRINAARGERVRVEGLSMNEAARRFAVASQLAPQQVAIRVAEYRSQKIFLTGQVAGQQRAVPYQGPEKVVELLQRTGGLTAGAAPDEVYVVRSRIAEGKQPEVYHVRMRAILVQQDERTNINLQPQDQIYVGETNRSAMARYLPPWLKPLFNSLLGMSRPEPPATG
jgi:polysaccharide biosynthesis/export protein